MEMILTRTDLFANSTQGELRIGDWFCFFTLELAVKDGLPGSCIPPGKYLVKLLPSPKFEQSTDPWVMQYATQIPHLLGIPNRSDILIHWGNAPHDTEGCILVGLDSTQNFIGHSREAFAQLWNILVNQPAPGEPITIEVRGGIPTLSNNAGDVASALTSD